MHVPWNSSYWKLVQRKVGTFDRERALRAIFGEQGAKNILSTVELQDGLDKHWPEFLSEAASKVLGIFALASLLHCF